VIVNFKFSAINIWILTHIMLRSLLAGGLKAQFKGLGRCSSCLDKHTVHCQSGNSTISKHKNSELKPLVLLFPWYGAPDKTIAMYSKLYEQVGCDVIVTQTSINLFLIPKYGLKVARKFLLDLVKLMKDKQQPLIIHSASVGCYFYSLMLYNLRAHPKLFDDVIRNVKAQILDSPVVGSIDEMAVGISLMTSSNTILQNVVKHTAKSYFFLTKPFTIQLYNELIDTIKYNPLIVPSLLMTSDQDPMAQPHAFNEFVILWKSLGIDLSYQVWTNSEHVKHLKFHKESYTTLIYDILFKSVHNSINLPSQQSDP